MSDSVDEIKDFRNEYEFLSNSYLCSLKTFIPALNQDICCASAEHAFQACKTMDENAAQLILDAATPKIAKKLGQQLHLIDNWEDIKLGTMTSILRDKFVLKTDLQIKILLTGTKKLIQGHSDPFWGQTRNGDGENNLGKILMKIRDEIFMRDGGVLDILFNFLNAHNLEPISLRLKAMKSLIQVLIDDKEELDLSRDDDVWHPEVFAELEGILKELECR